MFRAIQTILALTGRRAGLLSAHAQARVGQFALLAALGVAAFGFLVALVTVALAQWLGVIPALAIMAGLCLAGCGGVMLAVRAERRVHAAALRLQAEEDRRMLGSALLAATPALTRGGLLSVVAGVAALVVIAGRGRRRRD